MECLYSANTYTLELDATAPAQLAVALISLAAMHMAGFFVCFGIMRPDYTFPAAFTWAMGNVAAELLQPTEEILEKFGEVTITGLRLTTGITSIIMLIQILVSAIIYIVVYYCRNEYIDDAEEYRSTCDDV